MTTGIIDCCASKEWILYRLFCFCLLLLPMLTAFGHGESTFIRTPQTQIVALADQDAVLRCDFSYPGDRPVSHIIEWSKRGQDVPIFILYQGYPPHIGEGYEKRLALAPDSGGEKASLLIRKVHRMDEGWYECKVQLLNRPPETPKNGSWVHLVVHAPPQIINAPPWEIYVKPNDQVHMHCDAEGTPRPKITWSKDGEVIRISPKVVITANSLTIRSITNMDVGTYECSARNAEGRVSRTSKLIMASGAVILRPPENMTRLEGDRADLHCKAEGKPNNLTFHWLRNDAPIEPSYYTELSNRVVIQTDGTLIINPTSKTDTGKYTCKVTNGIEETPEASAWLSIQYPARINFNPSLQYLPLNLSGIIRCYIESNPAVQFVQWTKDSRLLDTKALPGVTVLTNGSLFIHHVTMDHQGQYTCTPYNSHGTGGSSVDMNILVEEPPMFTVIPKQFHQAEQKGTVTMTCAAKVAPGRHKPRLYWRRNDGIPLPSDTARQHEGQLTITNLRKTDYGAYDCILENDIATLVATTTLLIESTTPHAPTNLTVDVGPFSARIKWRPAYNGGFSQHYVIWYRHFGASSRQWRTLRVRPDDASSFTVYNLSPDTTYEVQVLSRNQLGDGMFSDPVIVRTNDIDSYATVFPTDASGATYVPTIVKPSGARPDSPVHVTVTATPEGARVQWEGPQNSSVPVMYYMVEYRKSDEPWGRSSDAVAEGRTFYVAKDIVPGHEYEFRVYAFTLTSFSEPSPVQKFRMISDFAGNLSPTVAITAGVVGGIIFFVVLTVLLLLCAGCARRKRRTKKARFGVRTDSNGFHPEDSTLTLKRGYNGLKTCGLRSLKTVQKTMQNLLIPRPHHTAVNDSTVSALDEEDPSIRRPLCKRGYSVQLEYNDERESGQPGSVMSGTSSDYMTRRPRIRVLQRPKSTTAVSCHHHHHSTALLPFYIPFTPTRSDLYQDYLDSRPGGPTGAISSSEGSVIAPLNYDREQLHETIQRLRGTIPAARAAENQSENTDSGVVLLASSSQATGSPSSSTATAAPLSTSREVLNADIVFEFESHRRAKSPHTSSALMTPFISDLDTLQTDARCSALLMEFRRYKQCQGLLSRESHNLTDRRSLQFVRKLPPLESEC